MSVSVPDLIGFKQRGERFAMLTAYDHTTAQLLSEAEIPVILVGDSLGMTMLGYPTTVPVTMADMLHHVAAVARGAAGPLVVADMPFGAYHSSDAQAIGNAVALLQAGAHAVKLEGGGRIAALTGLLTERGIPVMSHLGLTPQFVNAFGGFRVQGKQAEAAAQIRQDALALEQAGCFAVVLEGVPRALASDVTHSMRVPTIGIGAGPDCDGQVLVIQDLLGLSRGHSPRFVKRYAELGDAIVAAARSYASDVAAGGFPDDQHSYH